MGSIGLQLGARLEGKNLGSRGGVVRRPPVLRGVSYLCEQQPPSLRPLLNMSGANAAQHMAKLERHAIIYDLRPAGLRLHRVLWPQR